MADNFDSDDDHNQRQTEERNVENSFHVEMDVGYNDDEDGDEDMNLQVATAPLLYERPSYYRQTRKRGKIFKTVEERYLRDDLGLGCYFTDENAKRRRKGAEETVGKPRVIESTQQLLSLLQPSITSDTSTNATNDVVLVLVDANVLLHNLDVLQQSAGVMPNLVIPQTALVECRANNMMAYDQTVELLRSVGKLSAHPRCCIFFADQHHAIVNSEDNNKRTAGSSTMNDQNDARLRKVAWYYGQQLKGTGVRVIFLTDDAASRKLAVQEQHQLAQGGIKNKKKTKLLYEPRSVRSWVQELEQQHDGLALLDLVANYGTASTATAATSEAQTEFFPPHVQATELSRGVQSGTFHRGVFRSVPTFGGASSLMSETSMGLVTIRRGDERVAITVQGWTDRNRAIDGDVVAVALHPIDKWIPLSSSEQASAKANRQPANSKVGISQETAEPTHSEMTNVPEAMQMSAEDAAQSLRPTGKVVGIIRRNFSTYSGSIHKPSKSKSQSNYDTNHDAKPVLSEKDRIAAQCEHEHADGSTTCVFFPVDDKIFFPVDDKIPPVLIRTTQRERLFGQRIVVAVDSWPAHSPYPLGHYNRTLGVAGSKEVETEVLLLQHSIPYEPFPAAVLACLPPNDYDLANDFKATGDKDQRIDLRHLPILSIDPPGCTDIDDALHCYQLPNGNYSVGVSIADVTHYVKAGTAIDLEAANRSTSTYLVDRRLDMLPSLLSTDLCSLKANVDRFAFSVIWEVTPDAQIVDVEFKKSIIHSIAALTYQEAQSMIDLPDTEEHKKDVQVAAVKGLAELARKFRKRRIDAGALTLASPEVKFVFDSESLNPTDVQAYAMVEANKLVEEFMLLANVTVAKKILRHYPTLSVLRRHPAPNRARFDPLISKAKSRGFTISIEDSKQLADSLDAAVLETDPYFNKLLRIAATRCLSPAQYFCSGEYRPTEWHHYGLAAPVYTHFTSPIRRYADVSVHRLLAAAIGVAPLPQHLSSKTYLHDLCANMNRRQRGARDAGRTSVQLHTLIFFSESDGEIGGGGAKEEAAYVLEVETREGSEPAITVIVPRYGIEGQVKLPFSSDDSRVGRFPEEHRLSVCQGGTVTDIRVFDKVLVRVWVKVSEDHQRELVLDLLEPAFGKSPSSIVPRASKTKDATERASAPSLISKKRRRKT